MLCVSPHHSWVRSGWLGLRFIYLPIRNEAWLSSDDALYTHLGGFRIFVSDEYIMACSVSMISYLSELSYRSNFKEFYVFGGKWSENFRFTYSKNKDRKLFRTAVEEKFHWRKEIADENCFRAQHFQYLKFLRLKKRSALTYGKQEDSLQHAQTYHFRKGLLA